MTKVKGQEVASPEPSAIPKPKPPSAAAAAPGDPSAARKASGSHVNVSGRSAGAKADPIGGAKGKGTARPEDDDGGDDDEEDVAPDLAQLEKQLQRARVAAGGGRPPPLSSNSKLSSVVKGELARELEALHGEKSGAKLARRLARDRPDGASSTPRQTRK